MRPPLKEMAGEGRWRGPGVEGTPHLPPSQKQEGVESEQGEAGSRAALDGAGSRLTGGGEWVPELGGGGEPQGDVTLRPPPCCGPQ